MKQLNKFISKILKYGTIFSTLGFIGATGIQIYARFFLDSAPSWTEEAARFFFIYAISFASGLAMKNGYYVHFDVFYRKMNPRQQTILQLLVSSCTLLLFLTLAAYGITFVKVGIPEHSPSLDVPMAIAFASMVLMGLGVSFYAFLDLLNNLKRLK